MLPRRREHVGETRYFQGGPPLAAKEPLSKSSTSAAAGWTFIKKRPRRASQSLKHVRFTPKSVFGTTTKDLLELSDWLAAHAVTHVGMERRGVYWKPIWNILEGQFDITLVNAQHFKSVPGRKTDLKDGEWLSDLLLHLIPQFCTRITCHGRWATG
jgi:hypothetical protein